MNPLSSIVKTPSELVLDLIKDIRTGLSLKENQLIEAKVIKLLPQGKAQLQIQNQVVDVKSQIPLTPNETLYLKVMKSGDSQVLKMVEAHKPVTPPSPGLAEVRALGREGPYEALAKVLNSPAAEKITTPGSGVTQALQAKVQTAPSGQISLKKEAPFPQTAQTRDSQAQPTAQSAQASSEQPVLTRFVKQSPLPLSFKLALVMTRSPEQMPEVPLKVIQGLSERLDAALNNQKSLDTLPVKDAAPFPVQDKTTALAVLTQKTRTFLNRLAPEDKAMAEQFVQNRTMSPTDKMAALLTPQAPSAGREPAFADIKNSLVKAFFPKGIPTESFLPLNTKGQPASPTQTVVTSDSSVFTRTSVFESLKNLIGSMALKPETPFDAKTLRHLVKNSGLLWESKLKEVVMARMAGTETVSLKNQMAELMQKDVKALSMNAQESGKHEVEKTLDTLKRFVDNVEKLQVLNSHTSEESGRYLLPLPYFSGEKLKFGQLFIDTDKKKARENSNTDRIIRVAFMLEMSQLGHVEADVAIFKKSLSGEFVVGSHEAKETLDEALPRLSTDLGRMGYTVSKLACRLENPEVLATHSLADRMVEEGDGAVSIMI